MATISGETKVLGINDAKINELLTDDGTTLLYGKTKDIPGVTNLKLTPKVTTKELPGDEKTIDTYSKLESIDWSLNWAKVSLEVAAVFEGGKTTFNESATINTTLSQASTIGDQTIHVTAATNARRHMVITIGTGTDAEQATVLDVDTTNNTITLFTALEKAHAASDTVTGNVGATVTHEMTGDDVPNYFMLRGKADYGDQKGGTEAIMYKCKADKVDIEYKGKEYASISASGSAIPTATKNLIKDVIINEVAQILI